MHPPQPAVTQLIRSSFDAEVDLRTLRREVLEQPLVGQRVLNHVRLFYRRVGDLRDPDRAVAVLGARMTGYVAVLHVLIEATAASMLPPALTAAVWSDCIHRALAARVLAPFEPDINPEQAFVAGFCAEWGVVPLLDRARSGASWLRDVRMLVGDARLEAERALFGRTHYTGFVRVGRAWEFPPDLLAVVGASHRDAAVGLSSETQAVTRLVRWGDRLGEAMTSASSSNDLESFVAEAGVEFGLEAERLWRSIEWVLQTTPLVASALGVEISEQPTIDQLRERQSTGLDGLDRGQLVELLHVFHEDNDALRRNVAALETEIAQLRGLDSVTGLPALQRFMDLLEAEVRGARADGRSLAVLLVDIDGFSSINAKHGFDVGDGVLREVGHMLQRMTSSVAVARAGADAFAVLLHADDRTGRIVAERARAAIEEAVLDIGGVRVRTTATVVGISLHELRDDAPHEAAFARAALLMTQSTNLRNRCLWRAPDEEAAAPPRRTTLTGMGGQRH